LLGVAGWGGGCPAKSVANPSILLSLNGLQGIKYVRTMDSLQAAAEYMAHNAETGKRLSAKIPIM